MSDIVSMFPNHNIGRYLLIDEFCSKLSETLDGLGELESMCLFVNTQYNDENEFIGYPVYFVTEKYGLLFVGAIREGKINGLYYESIDMLIDILRDKITSLDKIEIRMRL